MRGEENVLMIILRLTLGNNSTSVFKPFKSQSLVPLFPSARCLITNLQGWKDMYVKDGMLRKVSATHLYGSEIFLPTARGLRAHQAYIPAK